MRSSVPLSAASAEAAKPRSRQPTKRIARVCMRLPCSGGFEIDDRRRFADRQELLAGAGGEDVHDPRDDAGPAGLVARAEARAVVAVEVFVEQDQVAPVRILLEP